MFVMAVDEFFFEKDLSFSITTHRCKVQPMHNSSKFLILFFNTSLDRADDDDHKYLV